MARNMKKESNKFIILLISCMCLIIYAFLHEGSHALAAIFLGGKITNFDINFVRGFPHMEYTGIDKLSQMAWVSIAGPVLPYILWLIVLFASRKNNVFTRKIILLSSVCILATTIPNIVEPILYEMGYKLENEDIVKFVSGLNINGYYVSVIFVLMFALGLFCLAKKIKIRETFCENVSVEFKSKTGAVIALSLTICFAVVIIVSFTNLNNIIATQSTQSTQSSYEPKKYDKLLNIDLSKRDYSNKTIYEFKVNRAKTYDFVCLGSTKEKISAKLVGNVQIESSRKNNLSFIDCTGKIQANWTGWLLNKGKYKIVLTSKNNKGNIKLYISSKDAPADILRFSNEKIFNDKLPKLDKGYQIAVKANLVDCSKQNIYSFTLKREQTVQFSIFLTTKTGVATVDLTGKNYNENLVYKDQVYTDGRGAELKKGNYNLRLTAHGCNGKIYVYIK